MPIYTYQCVACGSELEKRQSFSDDPLMICPRCQGALRRVVHPVGIIFKGSGFHNTDYRKSAATTSESSATGKEAAPATDAKNGAASASKDGAAEAKPATAAKEASAAPPAATPAAS